jgi:hypothetical protein
MLCFTEKYTISHMVTRSIKFRLNKWFSSHDIYEGETWFMMEDMEFIESRANKEKERNELNLMSSINPRLK